MKEKQRVISNMHYLTESTMKNFIQSEDTYYKLYHLYFMNTLKEQWSKQIELSIDNILKEIEISLKN